jgi:hypothetical protein
LGILGILGLSLTFLLEGCLKSKRSAIHKVECN